MYHKAWDGKEWLPSHTGWDPLGGVFSSPPAVASWGSGRLDIFGIGTDNQMYHKWWDGKWGPSQTDWDPLGGVFSSPPAVASWGSGRLDIFGIGFDNQMYHKWRDGTEWGPSHTDWDPLGGSFISPPAVASWGSGRLDIFELGAVVIVIPFLEMVHKWFDGGEWGPSHTDWDSLGGAFLVPTPKPAVPAPAAGLGSYSNYILYSNCNPLLDLTVTIDVGQDIICQSQSGPIAGFSFQLNAYSPKGEISAWQQYVIALWGLGGFETQLGLVPPISSLVGAIDNWPVNGPNIVNWIDPLFPGLVVPPAAGSVFLATIPAGYQFSIGLKNDANANVIGATFIVKDNRGNTLANVFQSVQVLEAVPSADLAPIVAFELNLVGPVNGESAVLSSGGGTITYTSPSVLTVLNQEPVCTETGTVTAETANSFYGPLPKLPSTTFVQSFNVGAAAPMIRRLGKARPSTQVTAERLRALLAPSNRPPT